MGWGGENDDLFIRLKTKDYTPTCIEDDFGRFMVRNLISLFKELNFIAYSNVRK